MPMKAEPRIIIVTGRPEKMRNGTIEQLKKIGVEFDDIYFRPEKDFRKDYELKTEIIRKLMEENKKLKIKLMIDDQPEVRKAINGILGIKAVDPSEIDEVWDT